MRNDILNKKDDIMLWISENKSKAYICKMLCCKQDTLNRYLTKMGIDYGGNQCGFGMIKAKPQQYKSLKDYLQYSKDPQTNKIRKRLLDEGIKEHKCECCGLSKWMGKDIPLEVHHIDGNKKNNTIENFMLLCPNCHALTDTYRGKNIKKC